MNQLRYNKHNLPEQPAMNNRKPNSSKVLRCLGYCFIALSLLSSKLLSPVLAETGKPVDPCMHREEHQSVSFLLIDRSDKLSNVQSFQQSLEGIRESIQPGERVLVGVSTGHLSETRIIMDSVKPAKSLWESPLKIRAKEKNFSECFQKMEQTLSAGTEEHKTSAILETLSFVANTLNADQSSPKRLFVISDMMQNSDALSFFKLKSVDGDSILKKLEKEQLVCNLKGTEVVVAGAGGGSSDEKVRQVEQFWKKYFQAAGAVLKFYGPIFLGA